LASVAAAPRSSLPDGLAWRCQIEHAARSGVRSARSLLADGPDPADLGPLPRPCSVLHPPGRPSARHAESAHTRRSRRRRWALSTAIRRKSHTPRGSTRRVCTFPRFEGAAADAPRAFTASRFPDGPSSFNGPAPRRACIQDAIMDSREPCTSPHPGAINTVYQFVHRRWAAARVATTWERVKISPIAWLAARGSRSTKGAENGDCGQARRRWN
jgi:hypothetical protein